MALSLESLSINNIEWQGGKKTALPTKSLQPLPSAPSCIHRSAGLERVPPPPPPSRGTIEAARRKFKALDCNMSLPAE